MSILHRLKTAVALIAVCLAGGATAVAFADSGAGRGGSSSHSTGTTGETTGTTGETTGTTTGETTGTTTGTTTTPGSSAARAPRIVELEADAVGATRLRLRAEVARRGARITSVRFTYRGVRYRANRTSTGRYFRVVTARGGDSRGDVISFRVTACAGKLCTSRSGSDEAGGGRRGRGNDDGGGDDRRGRGSDDSGGSRRGRGSDDS